MKLFELHRVEDESGVSGVGVVAQGVIFDNKWCALTRLTPHSSVAFYPSIETVEAIHGHGGKTRVKLLHQDMYCVPTLPLDPEADSKIDDMMQCTYGARKIKPLTRAAVVTDTIRIVFIINHETVPVELDRREQLKVALNLALHKSYNTAHPLETWSIRDECGRQLDPEAVISTLPDFPNNLRLFSTLRAR